MKNKIKKEKGMNSKEMSKLYWEARKKKYNHNRAFKAVGLAKELSKKNKGSKWMKEKFGEFWKLDFDGDGKINKYDCRPFDKKRQDDIDTYESEKNYISEDGLTIGGPGTDEWERNQSEKRLDKHIEGMKLFDELNADNHVGELTKSGRKTLYKEMQKVKNSWFSDKANTVDKGYNKRLRSAIKTNDEDKAVEEVLSVKDKLVKAKVPKEQWEEKLIKKTKKENSGPSSYEFLMDLQAKEGLNFLKKEEKKKKPKKIWRKLYYEQ